MKEESIADIMNLVANTPRTVRNIHEKIIKRALGVDGESMSRHHFEVLKSLDEYGDMSVTELSGMLVISKSQMTRLISELSAIELVGKKADPGDRRKSIIALTDKGQQSITKVNEHFQQIIREILQPFSEQELAELSFSLNKIDQIVQKIPG